MITYHCDQCGSKVSPGVHYTAVTDGSTRQFCSVICVSAWAVTHGYREVTQEPKPPVPMIWGDGKPEERPLSRPDSGSTGIQAAAGPYGAPEVFAPTTAAPEPEAAPHRLQDAVKHTCVICGREGTRRYVHSSIGWRCAATATACPGNRKPLPSDFRPKAIQADVTPAAQVVPEPVATPPRAAQGATPVTARCGGCPRTWNLTGRVLTAAVSFHEHQHEGHMVEVLGVDE